MLKRLPVFLLFLFFLTAAGAQTHSDSVKQMLVDTLSKSPKSDTTKHTVVDTGKHAPADTVTKHSHAKAVVKKILADTLVHSPLKTLSDKKYNAYLRGEDMDDMSLAGELNDFPLPDKVLKFKKQLDLSPIQVTKLNQLATELHRKKVEMGNFIITNEKKLDELFRTRKLDEGNIIFYANRSGLYYGELRVTILMACLNTEKLLTDPQLKKLVALEKK